MIITHIHLNGYIRLPKAINENNLFISWLPFACPVLFELQVSGKVMRKDGRTISGPKTCFKSGNFLLAGLQVEKALLKLITQYHHKVD